MKEWEEGKSGSVGEPGSGRAGERGSRGVGERGSWGVGEPGSRGVGEWESVRREDGKRGGVVARHCEALAEQSEAIPTGLVSTIFLTNGLEIIHHEVAHAPFGHPEIRENAWSAATTTDARPSTLDSFTKELMKNTKNNNTNLLIRVRAKATEYMPNNVIL